MPRTYLDLNKILEGGNYDIKNIVQNTQGILNLYIPLGNLYFGFYSQLYIPTFSSWTQLTWSFDVPNSNTNEIRIASKSNTDNPELM